jgi:hypothetical protein
MKQENLFTVAGTSNLNGEVKVRFANDLVSRIKALHRGKHTDVNLIELPKPMTKLEALQYLQQVGITDGDAGYVVAGKIAEKSKLAKKGEVKVKAVKVTASVKTDEVTESV